MAAPVRRVTVPIKVVNGEDWAELSALAPSHTHHVCAEFGKLADNKLSFAGGHRVRLFHLKKNVHWRIPTGMTLDISEVPEAPTPPARRRRHGA
jgi:hypothetical protein